MITFISSIEIISEVIPNLQIFFWITASVADAAAADPYGYKAFSAF